MIWCERNDARLVSCRMDYDVATVVAGGTSKSWWGHTWSFEQKARAAPDFYLDEVSWQLAHRSQWTGQDGHARQQWIAAMMAIVGRMPICSPRMPAARPASGMVPKLTTCDVVTARPIISAGT